MGFRQKNARKYFTNLNCRFNIPFFHNRSEKSYIRLVEAKYKFGLYKYVMKFWLHLNFNYVQAIVSFAVFILNTIKPIARGARSLICLLFLSWLYVADQKRRTRMIQHDALSIDGLRRFLGQNASLDQMLLLCPTSINFFENLFFIRK